MSFIIEKCEHCGSSGVSSHTWGCALRRGSIFLAPRTLFRTTVISALVATLLIPLSATAAQAAPDLVLGFDSSQQVRFQYDRNDPSSGARYIETDGVSGGELIIPERVIDSAAPGSPELRITQLGSSLREYEGVFTRVVVPGSVKSFDFRLFRRATVLELELGEGVTSVDQRAFRELGLTKLTLPSSLTTLGAEAFADNNLTSLHVPASLHTIGTDVFARNRLNQLSFADGFTAVAPTMFAGNELDSLSLPDSVTSIGSGAFANNFISSLTLGPQLRDIGDQAFVNNSLSTLRLTSPSTTIGSMAFAYNNLSSLELPEGLTSIPDSAFIGNALLEVKLPDSLREIGPAAFALNELRELSFGDRLESIDDSAFAANKLSRVTFGTGIQHIAPWAFAENPNLTRVVFTAAPPATLSPGGDEAASLGDADGLVVLYPRAFGETKTSAGFSTPSWQGYTAAPSMLRVSYLTHGGTAIPSEEVAYDSLLSLPAQPAKHGFLFSGWFNEAELHSAFDQRVSVTADITIHAGWRAFPPNGASATAGHGGKGSLASTGSTFPWQVCLLAAGLLLTGAATAAVRHRARG